MNGNEITVVGNLTRDPELRYTQSGKGVCNFSVASNRRYQVNGEWESKPTYFDCSAWDALGENIAASFTKGNAIIVVGRMESRQYETNEGDKRTAWTIVADEVGASVRWARVQVTRTERTQTAGGMSRQGEDLVPAGHTAGPRLDPVYGDEEPF